MQIPKTFLAACAATFFLASISVCSADDSPAAAQIGTNIPPALEINTNTPVAGEITTGAPAAVKMPTNAPVASEIKTNDIQSVQSPPPSQAEMKKQAEEKKKAAKPASMKNAPTLAPIAGPPNPLSADKQQRLAELLQKYKADQITPEEYHSERAKILAEP